MNGIRPSRRRFVTYSTWAEKDVPGITTLNTQKEGRKEAVTRLTEQLHQGMGRDSK